MSWAADHYVLYEMDGSEEKKILSASAISNVQLAELKALLLLTNMSKPENELTSRT